MKIAAFSMSPCSANRCSGVMRSQFGRFGSMPLANRNSVNSRVLTEFLFASGMDPNLPNWLRITPLHRFAEHGDIEKAAIFIDHGADLHARDEEICSTPLG